MCRAIGLDAYIARCYSCADGGVAQLHTRRCECSAADCTAVTEMTWEEQDAVDHNDYWVVSPGHEPRGGRSWRVVDATERFVVVAIDEEHDI